MFCQTLGPLYSQLTDSFTQLGSTSSLKEVPQKLNKMLTTDVIKAIGGVAFVALSLTNAPRLFFCGLVPGYLLNHVGIIWSKNITASCGACISGGCTDIVAQNFFIKPDPRVAILVAGLFFGCHIPHHPSVFSPVVGAMLGAHLWHKVGKLEELQSNLGNNFHYTPTMGKVNRIALRIALSLCTYGLLEWGPIAFYNHR